MQNKTNVFLNENDRETIKTLIELYREMEGMMDSPNFSISVDALEETIVNMYKKDKFTIIK